MAMFDQPLSQDLWGRAGWNASRISWSSGSSSPEEFRQGFDPSHVENCSSSSVRITNFCVIYVWFIRSSNHVLSVVSQMIDDDVEILLISLEVQHGWTMHRPSLAGGFNHSEKYEFVSWDDFSIPNWMGKESSHVPVTTNQIYIYIYIYILYIYIIHILSID